MSFDYRAFAVENMRREFGGGVMKTLREAADEMGQLAAQTLDLDRAGEAYISGLLFGFALRSIAERRDGTIDELIAEPTSEPVGSLIDPRD